MAKPTEDGGRAGLPARMPATAKLVLVAAAVSLAGLAASLSYGDRAARDGLASLAVESWRMQSGQIARDAAGGIAEKNPAKVAGAYALQAKGGGLLRVVAFDAAGAEVGAYAAPGFYDAASEATIRTLARAVPQETLVQPLDGRVVMVAPALSGAAGPPIGSVALVWDTAQVDRIGSALWFKALAAQALVALAGLAAIVLAAGAFFTRPLRAVAARAQGLAGGDLESPVACQHRGDEIGVVARSLAALRDRLLERLAAERRDEAERVAAEAQRQESDTTRAAAAKLQAAVVRLIAAALARVAEGDLASRLRVDFPKEYLKLKEDFNLAMDRLQEAMRGVDETGGRVESGTAEILRAADELARRTKQQAAGIEQTVAAIDEIAKSVARTAESAADAREAFAAVAADAGQSQAVVGQAIAAMNGIERSSVEVAKIIGVIDEIAFQTNLLALNAGVEAARAGEAGRGFVVVAQEVRTLAQRSAEAAKEIKDLITASAGQVKNGSRLVSQTGESIGRINDSVGNISAIVATIARSAGEQTAGLKGIGGGMNGIDAAIQRNAAMAEQFAAAGRALARESEMLAALVASFRVEAEPAYDRQGSHGVRRAQQAEDRHGQQPPARLAPPPESRRSPRMPRAAVPGATAVAFDDAADAWQEF